MILNNEFFYGLGDSPWWYYMNQVYKLDLNFSKSSNSYIYEPNISQENGNKGINIVKDGSVTELLPSDGKTLISTVQEPISAKAEFDYHENVDIPNILISNGVNPDKIAFVSGDFFVNEFNTTTMKSFFVPGWNHLFWGEQQPKIDLNSRSCDNLFLSFNRIHKPHRLYFMCRLYELDLIENNLVSCADIIDGETFEQHMTWIYNDKNEYGSVYDKHNLIDIDKLKKQSHELQASLPYVLDVSNFQENGCFESDTFDTSVPFYQNSFMSVITESNAVGPGCYISEAIFRPFVFMQPFLTIAQPRTLQVLREWGFDVFDDIFDNSYDLEPDMFKRTEMVIEQIQRFSQLTPEQLRKITLDLEPRLLYNYNRYFGKEFKQLSARYFDNVINWFNEK
jgi:hypothetical protein